MGHERYQQILGETWITLVSGTVILCMAGHVLLASVYQLWNISSLGRGMHATECHSGCIYFLNYLLTVGTGITGLMRGMATLLQGNQELIVVRDKVGRLSGELGVRKSIECDIFSLQCFDTVGWATERASGL